MINVVLVMPEGEENTGAVARAMLNMGFKQLILVQPFCNHLSQTTLNYAVHAQEILKNTCIYNDLKEALNGSDLRVAISRRIGQWRKRDFTAEELALFLLDYRDKNIHLVFGREKNGLTNPEINLCDVICSIPSSDEFPSLNLAQAVMIILYEIFKLQNLKGSEPNVSSIANSHSRLSERDKFDQMMNQIISAFDEMEFFKNVPDWRLKNYLKKILIRAKLDEYDTLVIRNVFGRIQGTFKKLKGRTK